MYFIHFQENNTDDERNQSKSFYNKTIGLVIYFTYIYIFLENKCYTIKIGFCCYVAHLKKKRNIETKNTFVSLLVNLK